MAEPRFVAIYPNSGEAGAIARLASTRPTLVRRNPDTGTYEANLEGLQAAKMNTLAEKLGEMTNEDRRRQMENSRLQELATNARPDFSSANKLGLLPAGHEDRVTLYADAAQIGELRNSLGRDVDIRRAFNMALKHDDEGYYLNRGAINEAHREKVLKAAEAYTTDSAAEVLAARKADRASGRDEIAKASGMSALDAAVDQASAVGYRRVPAVDRGWAEQPLRIGFGDVARGKALSEIAGRSNAGIMARRDITFEHINSTKAVLAEMEADAEQAAREAGVAEADVSVEREKFLFGRYAEIKGNVNALFRGVSVLNEVLDTRFGDRNTERKADRQQSRGNGPDLSEQNRSAEAALESGFGR